ncbi:hypothetical protein A9Q99_27200 [Gammaproteobacteria bacterium 45_16_T64]|nr:hypothetical protein A9Q99_27200 [Gammaproteobacteria bacterium 45_16_T64]
MFTASSLAQLLTNKNRLFAILSIGICLTLMAGLPKLGFDPSYRVFFSPSNPQLVAFDNLNEEYSSSDKITFVVVADKGSIYSQENLHTIVELTKKAWELPFSHQVQSLVNFPYTEASADDFIVYDLIDQQDWEENKTQPKIYLADIEKKALSENLLINRLISEDKQLAIIDVSLILDNASNEDRPLIINAARELQASSQKNSNLRTLITGSVMYDNTVMETSANDASALLPLMLVFSLLFSFLILRSLAMMISSQVVVIFSVLAGMGLAGYLQYDLNAVSAMAGLLIIILALADTIHIGATYLKELQKGHVPFEAIKISIEKNVKAVFLTSTTTAAGFYSLNFMDSNAFSDLGNIAIFGVAFAFILSLTLFPCCLLLLTPKKPSTGIQQEKLSQWISHIAIRHRKPLFIGFFVVTAVTTPFLTINHFNDDFLNKFPKDTEINVAATAYMDHMPTNHSINYSLDSHSPNGINSPEYLHKVERFIQWYEQQPEVTNVYSYVDFAKRLNQNMHGGDEAWYRIPDSPQLASQYLLIYEMSLGYGQSLSDVINHDKSSLKMTVTTKRLDNIGLMNLEHRATQWQLDNEPSIQSLGTSKDLMFAHQGESVVVNAQKGAAITILLITAALILGLGSLKYGIISMIPNLVPAGVIYGLWGIFVQEMDQAVAITYSISLGLVVDDTVHVLSKYIQERKRGISPRLAIEYTLENTATALIVTTVMIGTGLVIMACASFEPNAIVGLIMAPIIAIAVLFDLFVLPGILLFIDEKLTQTTEIEVTAESDGLGNPG